MAGGFRAFSPPEVSHRQENVSNLKRNFVFLRKKRHLYIQCFFYIRGMFEMNCLLSYISISTWGTIKTNIFLSRFIQGLHNGV